jgi:hypothetical protein
MTLQFGDLIVNAPSEIAQLTDEDWRRLECAMIWQGNGLAASARRSILGLEADLQRAANLRGSAAAGRTARAAAMAISTPRINPALLDELDQDDVSKADDKMVKAADLRRDAQRAADFGKRARAATLRQQAKTAETEARLLVIGVGKRVEARVDAEDVRNATDAAMVLEISRGGEVDDVDTYVSDFIRDEHGALVHGEDGLPALRTEMATARRVNNRSGLKVAYVKGYLDGDRVSADDLYEEGKRYAENYRTAESMRSGERTETHMAPGSGAPQVAIFAASAELRIMRAGLTAKKLAVLDLICGLDHSIRATAEGLRAGAPSVVRALRGGLAQARLNRIEEDKRARAERKKEA